MYNRAMSLSLEHTGDPTAPTLLFVHGMGVSRAMWRPQTAALTEYHCLTVDLPGHGGSHATPWRSQAETAAQLADLIAAHGRAGRAHVVGLSLGAMLGLRLACDHPERVERLVLSGLNVRPLGAFQNWLLLATLPLLKQPWMIRASAKQLKVPEADYAAFYEASMQVDLDSLRRASPEASAYPMPDLARLRAPTLLVAGQHEVPLIHQSMRQLRGLIPSLTARVAPGVGHVWNGEAPDLFNRMVRAWIAAAPLPAELRPAP